MPIGLGEEWRKIYRAYDEIPHVYERVNMAITFLRAQRWRIEILEPLFTLLAKDDVSILDAGSGPGSMSLIVKAKLSNPYIVLLDYSFEMLKSSLIKADRIRGIFEYMPIRDKSFDAVIMGYSFHASIDMEKASAEIARVTRKAVAIVSIGKSDNLIKMFLVKFYMRFILPLIAFLVSGKYFKEFNNIYEIYIKIPTNKEVRKILEKRFKLKIFKEKAFGSIYQILAIVETD